MSMAGFLTLRLEFPNKPFLVCRISKNRSDGGMVSDLGFRGRSSSDRPVRKTDKHCLNELEKPKDYKYFHEVWWPLYYVVSFVATQASSVRPCQAEVFWQTPCNEELFQN